MFEINNALVKNQKEADAICGKFCLLMDVRFNNEFNLKMFALSVFTFCYSIMVAMDTILDSFNAYKLVFKNFELVVMIDSVINTVIPFVLSHFGFILTFCKKDYISAVLNCLVLLFIPEIDNQLPKILGYQEEEII